jgi:branched-chain amino acid aminotransferase
MELPYTAEELRVACHEVVAANGLAECYLRPIAFYGYGELGVNPGTNPVDVYIMSWPWGTYLGDEGITNGVRAKTSSWVRIGANMIPTGTKACGVYINSSLAKVEALKAGYDEAILLNEHGNVAEGSGENIFVVRDGTLLTPPLTAGVLRGVTRDSIIEFAADLGIPFAESELLRHDLYVADEAFYTGTAAEVVPIRSVDDRELGPPGPITRRLQELFFAVVAGKEPRFAHMLDHVHG